MVNLEKIKLKKCQPPPNHISLPFKNFSDSPLLGVAIKIYFSPLKKKRERMVVVVVVRGRGGGGFEVGILYKKNFYPPTSPVNNNFHVINFLHYPSPSGGGNFSHPLTPYGKSYNIVNFMFIYL